jgi:tungstate transport system substrate-binding protein
MRRFSVPSFTRRTVLALVIAAVAASFAVPMIASAAVKYVTIKSSNILLANAKPFELSGTAGPSAKGKIVTVYVEKPGSSSFSVSGTSIVNSKGKWYFPAYNPKIKGKYYFKAVYSTAHSATILVNVLNAPVYDIILASTTSTQDSGLFSVLIPAFQKLYPWENVKVVAVGSGEALTLGQNKDADVCLVHSPASELTFMANGYGVDRRPVCFNDFVIVGPASDPAHISGDTSAIDAFQKIAAAQAPFVSRGDASGTNTKELGLWTSAGITAVGQPWYFSSGQGMGATLLMSDNLNAYTLSDIATWVAYSSTFNGAADRVPDLTQLVRGDGILINPYHVIRIPGANNMDGALLFENYITSPAGQTVIGTYGVKQYGVSLFTKDYGTTSTPIAALR